MSFFAKSGFDPDKVEADNGFDPLPAGTYVCVVETAEEKPCKNDGLQLVAKLKVIGEKYKGRIVFHRINLQNQNAQAVAIGHGQLSALCKACGIKPKAAHELCNRTIKVTVSVIPDNRTAGAFQNKVVKVEPSGPAAPSAAVASAPLPAGSAPWG